MRCQKIPHNVLKLKKKGLTEYLQKEGHFTTSVPVDP